MEYSSLFKKTCMKSIMIIGLAMALMLQSCYYDNKEDVYQFFEDATCDTTAVSHINDIVPIMDQYCLVCHNDVQADGNVNLSGYDNLKIYAENGSLYGSVIHQAGYSPMPSAGQLIPQCDQDKIKAWIDNGMLNN